MKKILIGLAAIVVLLVAAVVLVPLLIPADKIKQEVVAQVKAATGRDLSIEGKVAASVFPSLSVQVGNVALANPAGFQAKDLARLGSLDVKLKLLPLLSGRVEVDSFTLTDPVIALEVDRNGRADWTFASPQQPAAAAKPPAGAPPSPSAPPAAAGPGGAQQLKDLQLGDVGIKNGTITYADARSGSSERIDGVNLTVSLKSLDSPLAVKGSLKWRNQAISLTADVNDPRVLVNGSGSTKTSVTLASDPLKLAFAGTVNGANNGVAGDVDLSVPSVRNLVAWTTGKPLDMPGTGLGPLAIKGKLGAAGGKFAFDQASINLDTIKSTGNVAIDTTGARPALKGSLDVEMLDVNPYLPPDSQGKPPAATPAAGSAPAPAQAPAQAAAQQAGWSDAPIDASALKAAEIDFGLRVGGIKVRKLQIGKSALNLALHGGKLSADLTQLALYKGGGTGSLKLDGSQPGLGVDATFALKGVQAEPLLTDLADFDRLSGTGDTQIKVTGRGNSEKAIVSSLSGNGSMSFLNGAIKGIDIAGMIRNVGSAFTAAGTAQKTDFTELSATYTIANGILTNKDLSMQSPLLRVAGAGTVDLPKRTVQYRVEPKVVASIEGQGGKQGLAGLTVPVIIEGPWSKLSYRPDLEAMAKGAAGQAVQKAIGGKLPAGLPIDPGKLLGR